MLNTNTAKILCVVTLTLNSGCAGTVPGQEMDIEKSTPIEIARSLYAKTDALAINPYRLLKTAVKDNDKARIFRRGWCYQDQHFSQVVVENIFSEKCQSLGGVIVGSWCDSNKSQPLFMFKVGLSGIAERGATCDAPLKGVGLIVTERSLSASDEAWMNYATANGYVSKISFDKSKELQRAASDKKKRDQIERKLEEDKRKKEENIRMLDKSSNTGTKVCRELDNNILVGFIESSTAVKIRIYIASAYIKGYPDISPGGFQPHYVWDSPSNWYVCE